jgi:hypothetical protein
MILLYNVLASGLKEMKQKPGFSAFGLRSRLCSANILTQLCHIAEAFPFCGLRCEDGMIRH